MRIYTGSHNRTFTSDFSSLRECTLSLSLSLSQEPKEAASVFTLTKEIRAKIRMNAKKKKRYLKIRLFSGPFLGRVTNNLLLYWAQHLFLHDFLFLRTKICYHSLLESLWSRQGFFIISLVSFRFGHSFFIYIKLLFTSPELRSIFICTKYGVT